MRNHPTVHGRVWQGGLGQDGDGMWQGWVWCPRVALQGVVGTGAIRLDLPLSLLFSPPAYRGVLSESGRFQGPDEDGFGPGAGGPRELPVGRVGAWLRAARRQGQRPDFHHRIRRHQHHRLGGGAHGTRPVHPRCIIPTHSDFLLSQSHLFLFAPHVSCQPAEVAIAATSNSFSFYRTRF